MLLAKRASSGSWRSVSAVQIEETRRDYSLGVLPDGVDRNSEAFSRNSKAMGVLISDLQSHIQKVLAGGGPVAVKRNNRCWRPCSDRKESRIKKKKQGIEWDKDEEEKFKAKVVEGYEREGNSYYSTARLWDDGIIDPADTRKVIGLSISASMNRDPQETKYGVFRM